MRPLTNFNDYPYDRPGVPASVHDSVRRRMTDETYVCCPVMPGNKTAPFRRWGMIKRRISTYNLHRIFQGRHAPV